MSVTWDILGHVNLELQDLGHSVDLAVVEVKVEVQSIE
jgi:hypothetical protein